MEPLRPVTRLPHGSLHDCPHPACSLRLPALIWACSEHWKALHPLIRQAIWSADCANGAGSPALASAMQRAVAFWEAPRDDRAIASLVA